MAKLPKPHEDFTPQLIDLASFLLAAWFVISVISNARDLAGNNVKNAPASYALLAALFLVAARTEQNGRKLTVAGIITLTILLTAGIIWLFGLSVPTSV